MVLPLGCGGGDAGDGPRVGSVRVTVATTGSDRDADGFTARLDGAATAAVRDDAPGVFASVPTGSHHVTLEGLAGNCATSGVGGATVSVRAGEESAVAFSVSCMAAHGSLQISVTTSGALPDPDGYQLLVDGGAASVALPVTGSATLDGLAAGDHRLAIAGLAMNCDPTAATATTAHVVGGQATAVSIDVSCDLGHIVYQASGQPAGAPFQYSLYLTNPDGTGRFQVTPYESGYSPFSAAWSPDGATLAFVYGQYPALPTNGPSRLATVNADGSDRRFVGDATLDVSTPVAWSPDGTRIAYLTAAVQSVGEIAIAVVNADGSGKRLLPHDGTLGWGLAWSPDGRQFVFSMAPATGGGADVFVVDADGTGTRQLTTSHDQPEMTSCAWSRDGTRIVYSNNQNQIVVVNADGTGRRVLTAGSPGLDWTPCWSPDGTRIVFVRATTGTNGAIVGSTLYVMNADGTGVTVVPKVAPFAYAPAWR